MANQLMDQAAADQLLQRGFMTQEQYDAMFAPVIGPEPEPSSYESLPPQQPVMGLSAKTYFDAGAQEQAAADQAAAEQAAADQAAAVQVAPPGVTDSYDMMKTGLAMTATAAQNKAADDIAALRSIQMEQDKLELESQEKLKQAKKRADEALLKFEKASQNLGQMSIDTGRYWNNKSVADKIGIGIAMALGAFGTGQTNKAAEIIRNAVTQDINAQKADYEIKKGAVKDQENAYALFRKIYLDETVALDAAKLNALQKAKIQLDVNASKYAGAAATGQYAQAMAQLQQQIDAQTQQLQQSAALGGDEQSLGMTPEQRESYVPRLDSGIPFGLMVYGSGEEKKQTRTALVEASDAVNAIKELKKMAQTDLTRLSPSARAAASTNVQYLVGRLRIPFTGPGVLTEAERAQLLQIIPNPTDIFQLKDVTLARLNTLENSLLKGAQTKGRAVGLKTQASTAQTLGFKPGE